MMSNVFGHADDNRDGNSEDDAFNSSVGERSSSGVHETEQNDVSERTERAHLPDIASVQLDFYPESTQPMSSSYVISDLVERTQLLALLPAAEAAMACSVFREQFRGQFPQGSAFALGRQQNGARCEQYIFKFPAYTKREAVPYSELLRRALQAPSNSVDGLKEFIVSRLRKPRAGRKRPRGQEAPEQNRGASAALPVPGTNHLPAALPSITASSTAGPSAVGLASPASLYFNPFTSTDHNCNATASAATAATLHAGALSGLLPTPFMSGVLFNPDDTGTVLHPPASYIAGAVSVPSSFPLMMSSVTDSATASAVDAAASTNPARCDSVGLCPTTPCATPTFFAPIGAAPLSTPLGGVDYCWGRGRRQHHGHRRGGAPQQRGAGRDVGASHAAAAIPPVPQQAGQVVPVASGAGRVARGDDPRSLDSAQYQRGGRITARSGAHRCREWHGGSSMKLARGYYCGVPPLLPP